MKRSLGVVMSNKVTKKECMDAIDYFFVEGFIEELGTDKKYYTRILLNKVAESYNMELGWDSLSD